MGHNQKNASRTAIVVKIGEKAQANTEAIDALEKKLKKERQKDKEERTKIAKNFLGQLGAIEGRLTHLEGALEYLGRPWYRKLADRTRVQLRRLKPLKYQPIEPTEAELELLGLALVESGARLQTEISARDAPKTAAPPEPRAEPPDGTIRHHHPRRRLGRSTEAEHPTSSSASDGVRASFIGALEADLNRLRGELDSADGQVADLELENLHREFDRELATARDLWEDQVLDKEERNKLLDVTLMRAETLKAKIQQVKIDASGIRRVTNR